MYNLTLHFIYETGSFNNKIFFLINHRHQLGLPLPHYDLAQTLLFIYYFELNRSTPAGFTYINKPCLEKWWWCSSQIQKGHRNNTRFHLCCKFICSHCLQIVQFSPPDYWLSICPNSTPHSLLTSPSFLPSFQKLYKGQVATIMG